MCGEGHMLSTSSFWAKAKISPCLQECHDSCGMFDFTILPILNYNWFYITTNFKLEPISNYYWF